MVFLKDKTKAAIMTVTTAALAVSIFTGCSTDDSDTSSAVPTYTSAPESTTDSTPFSSSPVSSGSQSIESRPVQSTPEQSKPSSSSQSTDSKPEQSTPASSSSKPTESKPTQSDSKPTESKPAQSSSKPVESKPTQSTPASSSTPTQSTPAPTGQTTASGEPIIRGKYTGYKPTDTTGMKLDSKGFPVDDSETNYRPFVDSSGQLWEYDPGAGWELASSGGGTIADHSDWNIGTDEIIGH